jgi:uncharacterized membrane protein YfcA
VEILLLLGAGLIGGALNSLAGGGSFIVFPALLLAGVPPVMANATNTFAALPGYVSGAMGFRKDILKYRHKILPYCTAALLGGYLGAELLLHVNDALFEQFVPWLMAIAVLLFAFGGHISRWLARRESSTRAASAGTIMILFLLLLICIYGGFFNAGLGIILLAYFALAGLDDIHAMNGLKLMVSSLVAAIAVGRFAFSGSIAWYEGTLALTGTVTGGYLSARIAHLIPTSILRAGIIAYGAVLTAIFFWQAYA